MVEGKGLIRRCNYIYNYVGFVIAEPRNLFCPTVYGGTHTDQAFPSAFPDRRV